MWPANRIACAPAAGPARWRRRLGPGRALLLGLLLGLVLAACATPTADSVAVHEGAVLTRAELLAHLPPGLTGADSAQRAADYIEQWRRELTFVKLLADSHPQLLDRHRLLVSDYSRQAARQLVLEAVAARADTVITPAQLSAFYQLHKAKFLAQVPHLHVLHLPAARAQLDRPGLPTTLEVQRALMGPRAELAARLGGLAQGLDSSWVTLADLPRYSAPPAVNLLAAPGRAVLVYPDAQAPQARVHFFYIAGLVSPGEPLPLPTIAAELRRALLTQRLNDFLEAYLQQVAPPSYVQPSAH